MENTETKVCRFCEQKIPVEKFQWVKDKRKSCKGYYKSLCNDCLKVYRKNLYIKNKEKYIKKVCEYQRNNRDVINSRKRYRFRNDIEYRITCLLRTRFYEMVRRKNAKKHYKSSYLIGCSLYECRKWIESKFLPGMTWDNHGEWEIDHIIPCSAFDLTKTEEQLKCFHYTNLQPLWEEDNLSKSNKIQVLTSEGIFSI
jgi:hypothetical protein